MCDMLTNKSSCSDSENTYQMCDGNSMTLCLYHSNVPNVLRRNGKPVLASEFNKQDRISALRELLK